MKNKKILLFLFVFVLLAILIGVFIYSSQSSDTAQITEVLQTEIPKKSAVKSFEVVSLTTKNNFAKAQIKPLDVVTDNAFVILQKKNGQWQIIWGPGTALIPGDPILKIIPKGL